MIEFYSWAAPNAYRVAIMLHECGLPHRTHAVDLVRGEQRSDAFRAINPLGVVPVIIDPDHGGLVLTQSTAILLHLARKTGWFLPAAAVDQALVLEALMLIMTDVAAAAMARFFLSRLPEPCPAAEALFRTRLQVFLTAIEERLKQGPYLAGDYSVADIALYPLSRLPVVQEATDENGGFERLLAWRDRVGVRPAVIAGMSPPESHLFNQ